MDQIDYRRVREYVEENLGRGRTGAQIGFFIANLALFVTFALVSWLVFMRQGSATDSQMGAAIMLTLGWFGGLIFHGASLLFNTRMAERQLRDSLTLRGIQREMSRLGISQADLLQAARTYGEEKPKRSGEMRLAEDGEFEMVEEDQPQKRSETRR
ncbi:MAG: hypothetical protein U0528_17580 [Anaerolineae bacterium]|nr:hypothetical protein [Anaerolineae bacterium]